MKNNNFEVELINNFTSYLQDQGVSSLSIKNYKSDLNHFSGWLILKVRSLGVSAEQFSECIPFISKKIGVEYRNFLLENSVPHITINRRLSTLRHLAKFFIYSQILDLDFMADLPNLDFSAKKTSTLPLIEEFEKHLTKEKASESTVKNYLSDVKHFLSWLEVNSYLVKNE